MRFRSEWWLGGALLLATACAPTSSGGAVAPQRDNAAASAAPQSAAAPTQASGSAPPAQLRKVPIALSALSATMTPIWVGIENGIFASYGIELEPSQLSPSAASQALSAGSVPLAVTGGSSISAWLSGASDRVFIAGVIDKSLFKILTNVPEIQRMEDLRGRSVGTTTPGSGGTLALYVALRRFGLEPNRDVEMIYLRDQPTVLNAMLTGSTGAGNTPPPFSEQGLAEGARLLVDTRDLNVHVAVNHITTTRGVIERDRDMLRSFLMGYVDGIQFARDNPDKAIDAIMHGTRQDNRADAAEAYNLNRDVWDPWLTEEGIQVVFDNSDQPQAKTARAADMIDLSILRELEASGWMAQHLKQ